MRKLLLLLLIVFFGNITAKAQITDQTVSVSPISAASTANATVSLSGSQTGINYYLRDNADNTVIEGPVAGTGNAINFTAETITATKTYNVLATSGVSTLNFDGIDDFVTTRPIVTPISQPNTPLPQGNSPFTIEAWVKPTSINSDNVIQWGSDSANQKNAIELLPNGAIRHYFWLNDLDSPATSVGDGNWHHIAVTYDGTTRSIYFDGTFLISDTPTTPNVTGPYVTIGQHFADRNFHGQMDEVRIWNTARTLTEIQNNKDTSSPTGSGLVVYYKFDENSGTTASDSSGNNESARLSSASDALFSHNMWVSGWVPDFELEMSSTPTVTVLSDQTVSVSPTSATSTADATVSLSGSQTGVNYYLRDNADNTVIEGPIAGTGNPISFTAETITATKTYNVLATLGGNALSFDGENDHLTANTSQLPQGDSSFTIEAWVKPTSINSDNVIQWGSDSANQKNAIELLPTGVIRHYFWANDLDSPATSLGDGNWHHIAVTYDGTTRSIYLDGVSIASDTPSSTPNVTGNALVIGQHFANRNFHGQMDEVRIWNTARTLTEIQNNKDTSSPTGSGLVAQYKFDENSGTTASDSSVNDQTASLINMDAANAWEPGFDFAELEMSITPTVTVTISETPAPTGLATQVYTGDDKTLANLNVTGTSITWYDAATAGTILPSTTALVDDTTYYASNTNGSESIARLAVTVNRISDNTQTLTPCTATVANLIAIPSSGNTAQWFATNSSTTALASTAVVTTGTYYVEQGVTGTIETLGSGFSSPYGVAVQSDGKILVADRVNNAIKRMNADGTIIEILGSGFNQPFGVAVQADGKILVADFGNNAIKRMNADGSNIEILSTSFSQPSAVAVQADGKILVANSDIFNGVIQRMDADGTNVITLGSGFNSPAGVAVEADGKILVADQFNSAIKRMNTDGTNIVTLGSGFRTPYGVAIQADGKILVADRNAGTIKRMDADGTNIEILGSGFNFPTGLAVEADGKILFADSNNNAIKRITEASISNRVAVSVTVPTTSPEIDVLGNGISIADGDTTPRTLDFTYFGDFKMSSRSVQRIFGIDNTAGTSDLNIASIVSTSDSDFGGMATNGYPRLVRAGTIGYFTVRFNLRTLGFKTATIIINSDDCDEGSYEFTLKGNVLPDLTITGSCSDTEVLGNYFEESFLLNGKPAYRKGGVPIDTSPSCNDFTNPTTCAEVDSTLSRYVMAWDGSQWEWYKESTSLDCVWFPPASMCIPNFGTGSGSTKLVLATNSSNTAVPPCTGWVAATAGCLPTLSNCETPNPEINIPGNNTVLNFDGVDDYVDLGTNVLATAAEFTIEAWYYPTTNNRNWTRILEFSNSTTQYFFLGSSQANSGQPYFFINDGSSPIADISAPNALPLNTWTHIAVTLSGTTATMYIDGTQVAQNTSFNLNPADIGATTNSWLGKSVFTGDPYYLSGNLDEVRIWNVARTAAEINANNYSKLIGNEAGLLAYYKFENAPGNADNSATGNNIAVAVDETGSNNATLNNFNRIGDASNWIYKEAYFWDGSESTDWNDSNNWSTVAVPLATESVVIPNVTNQPVIDASTSIEIANITMTSNSSLAVDGVLKIANHLSNDGEITFKSNTSTTGQLDEFTGTISGTGDITVERFIPAGKRAFRFISPSVTTSTSMYDNWQEGGATAAGLGIHISGVDGAANGFDTTGTNDPSMFFFDNTQVDQVSTSSWFAATSTASNLVAGTPTRLFVRGDRTINLNSNASAATATTLRATGDLHVGDFTPTLSTTAGNYSFVGNPYQAAVDVNSLSVSGDLNTNFMYVWDPQLGATGTYVTVDLSDGSNTVGSNANQFIQPGQAFFVRNNLTVNTAPSITFTESAKNVAEEQLATFSTSTAMRYNVQLLSDENNVESVLDGVGLRFRESYNNNVDNSDAGKLWHPGENIAILTDSQFLSIEQRIMPVPSQAVQLSITGYQGTNYGLRLSSTIQQDVAAIYVQDHYLNTLTPLTSSTDYAFTIDPADAASSANLRFSLVFEDGTLSNTTVNEEGYQLFPNPTSDQFYIAGLTEEQHVKVFDLLGKQVLDRPNYKSGEAIDISRLDTGVYVVEIVGKDTRFTHKIIKR